MSTIVVNIMRRPDLSHDAFIDHWRNRHAPLIRSCPEFTRHLVSYTQFDAHAGPPDLASLFGGSGDYDGIAVLRFRNRKAMETAFACDQYVNTIRPDEPNFVDLENCTSFVTDAFDVIGAPSPLFDVTGKTAVVTGGAKGIGAMLSAALCEAGADVIVLGRDGDAGNRFAQSLEGARGTCSFIEADLADNQAMNDAVAQISGMADAVHVLVNNAGTFTAAPIEDTDTQSWDALMGLNLRAPFFLTKALLPLLRAGSQEGDPARVIMIGSIASLWGNSSGGAYGYAASKAAVHQLTRMLASDLTGTGINVNAIAPGYFPSDMTDGFFAAVPGLKDQVIEQIPAGRLGAPEDAAGAVLYLSSRAGAYVSGAVIPVEGALWQA